ncbi:MAG: ferritin-like domain-containing protein [Bacillota bacterium]
MEKVQSNPLGLNEATCRTVVLHLNADLATVYTFYHQIKKHHWLVEGPQYLPLHEFLDEWAAALLKAGDAIAERITALGGYPISGPAAQQEISLITMEAEGTFGIREMLDKDLKDGALIAHTLRTHIGEAMAAGDYGTEHLLKGILLEHEQMVHHLEHFLSPESLG